MNKSLVVLLVAALLAGAGWMVYAGMYKPNSQKSVQSAYPTKFFNDVGTAVTATPTKGSSQSTGTVGTSVQDMNVELRGTVDDGGARDIDQVTKDTGGL